MHALCLRALLILNRNEVFHRKTRRTCIESISVLAALHIQLLYVYLCTRASALKLNSMGLKQQVMDSTVFRFFFSVPPRWTKGLPPRKSDVIIGRNETIDCTVTADPEAAITWFKNGQPLQSSRWVDFRDEILCFLENFVQLFPDLMRKFRGCSSTL